MVNEAEIYVNIVIHTLKSWLRRWALAISDMYHDKVKWPIKKKKKKSQVAHYIAHATRDLSIKLLITSRNMLDNML